METEQKLEQELAETAAVAEEVAPTPEHPVDEAVSGAEPVAEQTPEEQAAQTTDAAEEQTEAPAEPAAAESASADESVLVATEDVPAAQSKMELARIAKEALIARAKELADSTEWRKTSEAQRELMEEWRKAGYAGKELNDKLWDEFRAARDEFYTRRDEHYNELRAQQAKVIEEKKQIIEEAKAATANVHNWVATADELNALFDRWKAAGNAGRENEQILWQEFNAIRSDFRNRRKADLAERRAKERENAEAKRKIVDEAKAIGESEEYTRENSDRMRELNAEYKAIGYAGKPANDTLWDEFRAAQNAYWDANSAHRDQQRRERRNERLQEAVERKSGQIEHLKDQNETLTTRLEATLNPEKVSQIKQWIAQNEQRLGGLKDDIDEIKKQI